MINVWKAFVTVILGLSIDSGSSEEKIYHPIRVVQRINPGYQFGYQNNQPLKVTVPPANYTGPVIFSHLIGKCFKHIDGNYRYEICPFHNVTQHEVSQTSWNAYRGVIGSWKEWLIHDELFHGMLMDNGDVCTPGKRRYAHVLISCADDNRVLSVKEMVTCFYVINFTTPAACHPDSRLVYPILPPDLRAQWDYVATLREKKFLTLKGYTQELKKIFTEAKLSSVEPTVDSEKLIQQLSSELSKYKREIRSVREENERLKAQLISATEHLNKLKGSI